MLAFLVSLLYVVARMCIPRLIIRKSQPPVHHMSVNTAMFTTENGFFGRTRRIKECILRLLARDIDGTRLLELWTAFSSGWKIYVRTSMLRWAPHVPRLQSRQRLHTMPVATYILTLEIDEAQSIGNFSRALPYGKCRETPTMLTSI